MFQTYLHFACLEKSKEGDNSAVGPMPLMQEGGNQEIRE